MKTVNSASTLLHSPLKHIDTQIRDLAKNFEGLDVKQQFVPSILTIY